MDSSMLLMLGGVGALVYLVGADAGWWPKLWNSGGGGGGFEILAVSGECQSEFGRPLGVCVGSAGYWVSGTFRISYRSDRDVNLFISMNPQPRTVVGIDERFGLQTYVTLPASAGTVSVDVQLPQIPWPDYYDGYQYWGVWFDAWITIMDMDMDTSPWAVVWQRRLLHWFEVPSG